MLGKDENGAGFALDPRQTNRRNLARVARATLGVTLVLTLGAGFVGCSGGSSSTSSLTGSALSSSTTEAATSTGTSSIDVSAMDLEYSDRDLDASYDASSATTITLSNNSATVSGSGAEADGSVVTITAAGTYVVSGTLADGQLVVNTDDSSKVQIVLDNANVTCSDAPAIYVENADKVFITLAEGTTNSVADGSSYADTAEDAPCGAIYSTADLTLNGSGSLEVSGNYQDAVVSKDSLVVTGGTYDITATDDALRGKDCVKVCAGTFQIDAGGDAIKSTEDSDTTKGFVSIDGGTFQIDAGDDAIQAVTYIQVTDGTLDVTAADDALHSDGNLLVSGGQTTIDAGDDAVHANYTLDVIGGLINATNCYEGFEGQTINISGGTNGIVASDDGINAREATTETDDTAEQAQTNQRDMMANGGDMTQSSSVGVVDISGGYTIVQASGDGVDSNGSLAMSGGVLVVSGPSDSGNGSLDYDSSAAITGGTFIAMGSTGMAQAFDSTSTQAQVSATVTGSAGDQVSIVDSSGNVVISATARSAYGLVLASSADLSEGSEYSVYIGGTPTDADSNGVATSGTLSGGSQSTTATASLSLQLSGTMGGGGMGGTGTTGGGNTGGMGGGTTGNSGGSGNMGGSAPGGGQSGGF